MIINGIICTKNPLIVLLIFYFTFSTRSLNMSIYYHYLRSGREINDGVFAFLLETAYNVSKSENLYLTEFLTDSK